MFVSFPAIAIAMTTSGGEVRGTATQAGRGGSDLTHRGYRWVPEVGSTGMHYVATTSTTVDAEGGGIDGGRH